MKKILKYFFICLLIVLILFFSVIIPINKKVKIEKSGCFIEYNVELNPIPNILCQSRTYGHCVSNIMSMMNSRNRVAECLCSKYNQEKSENLRNEILSFCKEEEICSDRLTRNNKDEDIGLICSKPNEYFTRMILK